VFQEEYQSKQRRKTNVVQFMHNLRPDICYRRVYIASHPR